jgi:DNA-binding transcriptional ArsR family regulator
MQAENEMLLDTSLLDRGRMTIRAINHPLRQKLIHLIHSHGRMVVTELYVKLGIEQSVASQHLAVLRREQFVSTERQGKFIFYSVNYQRIKQVQDLAGKLADTVK